VTKTPVRHKIFKVMLTLCPRDENGLIGSPDVTLQVTTRSSSKIQLLMYMMSKFLYSRL